MEYLEKLAIVKKPGILNITAIAVLVFIIAVSGIPLAAAQTVTSASAPESVTIPSGQKFIMQLETALHTRTTHKGDPVEFLTAADVVGDDQVLIPNKSLIRATVTRGQACRPHLRTRRNPAAI